MRIHCLVITFLFSTIYAFSDFQMYLNQLGYYPQSTKIALIPKTEITEFTILNEDEIAVYSGKLSLAQFWDDAGDHYSLADFSKLTTEGSYRLKVGREVTPPFTINRGAYSDVALATVKALYFQRASTLLDPEHAGKWARAFGHPDDACVYHPSTGKNEGTRSSPGGWYDAGDYGKYTIPLAYTTYRLLSLYERYPFVFSDGTLNIPESGNGRNDLLDEMRVGLDWLHTMQDTDGAAFHKLTSLTFEPKDVMPHQARKQRWIIGKSTKATLDYAAALAQAARVYREIDSAFSKACIQRAERAWAWAKKNPRVHYKNPEDVRTGEYGGRAGADEFFWAAVELLITTQKPEYRETVKAYDSKLNVGDAAGWNNVKMHGVFSLLQHPDALDTEDWEELKDDFLNYAREIALQIDHSPGRIVSSRFGWGSNGYKAYRGVALMEAFRLSGKSQYITAAGEIADYLLGKNPLGYSFISGFGSNPVKNIHHRLSIADGVEDLIPGLVSGGPNKGQQDRDGVDYPNSFPAKSFVDDTNSYASNEVTTYWNAEAAYLLTALEIEHRHL
ncbi:MAG: glycoside hydrolase family 9 protein [Opitutales bacterium]